MKRSIRYSSKPASNARTGVLDVLRDERGLAPHVDVHPLFAMAHTVGWIAERNEMISAVGHKTGRSRQLHRRNAARSYAIRPTPRRVAVLLFCIRRRSRLSVDNQLTRRYCCRNDECNDHIRTRKSKRPSRMRKRTAGECSRNEETGMPGARCFARITTRNAAAVNFASPVFGVRRVAQRIMRRI